MANPNLQKIIKLTSSQYDLLSNGGSITHQGITYTGLNDNYLYLIQEDSPDIPIVSSSDMNKYLHTNSSTGVLEWKELGTAASKNIGTASGNIPVLDSNGKLAESVIPANYLPLSGGTMTGNLEFSSISYSNAPVSSKGLTWRGGTDAAEIYYRLDANDAGRLVFKTHDDDNCNFVWENSVQGQWMSLSKDGTLAVKGDITSKGNKVALDKDVVKLTGDQNISGRKIFDGVIRNTYLTGGVLDTHPESGGTCIGYYTNDLVNLRLRGGSYIIKNLTQNTIIANNGDADAIFDGSPSYYYISNKAANNDVVEIIIKTHITFNWTTRGGIGFGNGGWGAKGVKIEAGYSATNTGTASSPDSDIIWVTRINETNNTLGMIYGILNGPSSSEGGTNNNSLNYLRVTLTNFHTTNDHRIASIFLVNFGSTGMLQTFLPRAGGTIYGSITPHVTNGYWLGNSNKQWAKIYGTEIYQNGNKVIDTSSIGSQTVNKSKYLISPSGVLTNADISDQENTDKAKLRIDLATSSLTTNKPDYQGFIYTNIWDIKNSKNNNTQLYIPNGYHIAAGRRLSVRGCRDDTWQTSWKELAYMSDLDNYTKKSIKLSDNVDLNTVTSSGFYRLMNHTQANFPHSQMIVCRGDDTIAQMVFPYDSTRMYVRTGNPFNTSGGLWHDWKQVAFTDHTHTSINTAFVFNNNDMPEAEGSASSANLAGTTTAHKLTLYRNGLSIPYQMDDSNDGGILRCRGNSESNTIFELATWDNSGAGETIQFNYYPTNSQVTPTYSVTVPKKTGTILLTTDSSSAGNAEANKVVTRNDAGSIQTEKLAVSSGTTTKATMQYNSTEDCIEFIFA